MEQVTDIEMLTVVMMTTRCQWGFCTAPWRMTLARQFEKGLFYQLVPEDAEGREFFKWYAGCRLYQQLFADKRDAVLNLLYYYQVWAAGEKGPALQRIVTPSKTEKTSQHETIPDPR